MAHDHRRNGQDPTERPGTPGASAEPPGKRTLVEGLLERSEAATPEPVQRKAAGPATDGNVHEAAQRGIAGGGSRLPHLDLIQRSFGAHDVSNVQAHTGEAATRASSEIGAQAYAMGNHVAFAGTPDLHTAAHEAAHVVQQRAGVQLAGGVGQVGDPYERHADAVADAVVSGRSAEALLSQMAPEPGKAGTDPGGGSFQRAPANAVVQRVANNRATMTDEWTAVDALWTVESPLLQAAGLVTLRNALIATWGGVSTAVRNATRDGEPDAPALMAFNAAEPIMRDALGGAARMRAALATNAAAAANVATSLQTATALVARITKLRAFHAANVVNTGLIDPQLVHANTRRTNLLTLQTTINQDRATWLALAAATDATAQGHEGTANGYAGTLAGIVPTIANITAPINNLLNAANFGEHEAYPNLALTPWAIGRPYWQALSAAQKTRLNGRLAGHTPTAWAEAGFPGTRNARRPAGYNGGTILVPTLSNFPLDVSGEVVSDWVNPPDGHHGQTAASMNTRVTAALAGTPIVAGLLGALQPTQVNQAGGRIRYGWQNVALDIIVANNATLITYYCTLP